jgi:hypothetical protein
MDMDMSIAALSVGLSQNRSNEMLGVSVLKLDMDTAGQGAEAMLSAMTGSLDPNLGTHVDVTA